MSMPLPMFNIKRFCEKCGYQGRVWQGLVQRPAASVEYIEAEGKECLLRVCKQCGYKWMESCV